MNPFEAWQIYQQDSEAPQDFIDFAFYFAVGAACERRVWIKFGEKSLFPNTYIVLVGSPSVGKGIAIDPALNLFKNFRTKLVRSGQVIKASHEDPRIASFMDKEITDPEQMAIPIGPDSATLPGILTLLPKLLKPIIDVGGNFHGIQSSLVLGLSEMTTFIRKQDEDFKPFMLKAYDCGDFSRTLKGTIEKTIRSICLNFFAGTTPVELGKVMKYGLLDDGTTSRTWFIFAERGRKRLLAQEFNDEQRAAKIEVLSFIQKLINLVGQLKFTPEAWDFYRDWYENKSQYARVNTDPTLNSYYGRIKVHVGKMIIIQKLIDDPQMTPIEIKHIIKAIKVLENVERLMHKALVVTPRNELAGIAKAMTVWIVAKGDFAHPGLLWKGFTEEATQEECRQIFLDMLRQKRWKAVRNGEEIGFAVNGTKFEEVTIEDQLIDLKSKLWKK